MRRGRALVLLGAVYLLVSPLAHTFGCASLLTARAQTVPKSLEEGGTDAAMRVRKNNWTVGVAGGQLSGTYMIFANELAEVLDDSDNLRVIPIVTYGAASNLDDLLYLRNIETNPWVSYVVDDVASTKPWTPCGVTMRGRAEIRPEGGERLGPGFDSTLIVITPTHITSWGLEGASFGPPHSRKVG